MDVVIGIDPHKASHHAFAIDDREVELAALGVGATRTQTQRLLEWAEPFACRTWAVEGADGLGYLLSQQLGAAGERVVDVPATLAARTRVPRNTRSNKTDPNDARSVALAALRHVDLREARRSVTARCSGCWRNGTSTSATAEARTAVACMPWWSSSLVAESPR